MTGGHDLDDLAREMRGRRPLAASALLLTLGAAITGALVWAWLAKVDDVTRAPGKVVPAGDVQQVQASEEGIISTVYVEEGQIVEAGDPLLELDSLVRTSQLNREVQRALALQARITRLRAEIAGETPVFSPDLEDQAPDQVMNERALFEGRAAELAAELAVLDSRQRQRAQEREEALQDLKTANRMQAILDEERAMLEPLIERGVEPRKSMLVLRRQEEELSGRILAARAALDRLATASAEVEEMKDASRSRFQAQTLQALTDATAELSSLQPSLPALESLAARAVLRAPVRGVVNQMNRRTIGGSVRAGESVAEIVPLDDALLVEADVKPQDIAFLRKGQPVRVKLTAYDFTRYGALDGTIIRIGASAVRRSEHDDQEVFVIVVRTEGAILDAAGDQVVILPGMTAEVDILAGKRRVIDYMLQPLERVRERAFRD